MNIEDYREYCLSVKGATECMPFDEHTLVLIEQYEDIFWGPFSDKKHWITVYLEGDVPDKLIKELISHSVEEVIKKLPKKKQEEYKNMI